MRQHSLRLIIATIAVGASLFSTSVLAAVCNPAVQASIQAEAAAKQKAAAEAADKSWKGILKQPEQIADSNGLLTGCVDMNWPSGGFKMPTISKIIESTKKQAIKRACSEARKQIAPANVLLGEITSQVGQYQTQVNGLESNPIGTVTGATGWDAVGGQFGGGQRAPNPAPRQAPDPGGIPGITP